MNYYDPVDYSLEENQFLVEQLGQPPVVALSHKPEKVNVNAVRPILERIYELMQLESHNGSAWVGVDACKRASQIYLEQAERWAADKRRGAPRFPTMHSYDSKGRPHRAGPGSDSGKVRTYFGPTGERIPFRVELVPSGVGAWVAEWAVKASDADKPTDGLKDDTGNNRIECLVCGHTETYKPESRASHTAARARISKHLRKTTGTVDVDERHREVHTANFGQQS